jgi:hypothetical protein
MRGKDRFVQAWNQLESRVLNRESGKPKADCATQGSLPFVLGHPEIGLPAQRTSEVTVWEKCGGSSLRNGGVLAD